VNQKPPSFFDRHPFIVFFLVFVSCYVFLAVITK